MADYSYLSSYSDEAVLTLAKCAEQAERYEDMAMFMKVYAERMTAGGKELDASSRNLLSVAYKNIVGQRRSAWRVIKSLEEKNQDESKTKMLQSYKALVEKELTDICNQVVDIIKTIIEQLKGNTDEEAAAYVFFLKMKGDYYRYQAELNMDKPTSENTFIEDANSAYEAATEKATSSLTTTHPIRLGLALNYSVFYYEIKQKKSDACAKAKKAFDDAIAELDSLQDDSYKDSTLIMQLLRDNLTLWTSESDQDQIEVDDVEDS